MEKVAFVKSVNGTTEIVEISQLPIQLDSDSEKKLFETFSNYGKLFRNLSELFIQWTDIQAQYKTVRSMITKKAEAKNQQKYNLTFEDALSKELGNYCRDFYELAEFNYRISKKNKVYDRFKVVRGEIYDMDRFYGLCYGLGTSVKHSLSMVPVLYEADEEGERYFFWSKEILKNTNLTGKTKELFLDNDKVYYLELLDHTIKALHVQITTLVGILLGSFPLSVFLTEYVKFVEPYGLPIHVDLSNFNPDDPEHTIKARAPYNTENFESDMFNSLTLCNELGMANININQVDR